MHAAAKCSACERFGSLMTDAVIQVLIGKGAGDPGEMDDGRAFL